MRSCHAGLIGLGVALIFVARASAEIPDAAALLRSARAQEAWIDRVESLWLKAVVTWEETPRGMAKRRREEAGNTGPVQSSLDLSRSRIQRIELAFDRTRIRISDQSPWGTDDLRAWDGKRFILRNFYEKTPEQDGYLLAGDIGNWLDYALVSIPSLQIGPRSWWWMKPERRKAIVRDAGRPEEFAYAGRGSFDGTECNIVCRWESWDRYYISVGDGRLRGLKTGTQSQPEFMTKILEFFRREGRIIRDE